MRHDAARRDLEIDRQIAPDRPASTAIASSCTSRPQPHPQRHGRDGRDADRPATRVLLRTVSHASRRRDCRGRTRATGLEPRFCPGSSTRSSPPRRMAWASACRSPGRSSRLTTGGSGENNPVRVRPSVSRCPVRDARDSRPAVRIPASEPRRERPSDRPRRRRRCRDAELLSTLLRAAGHDVRTYASAEEFLLARPGEAPGCACSTCACRARAVWTCSRPSPNGESLPIVFLSGHGDIPMSVRAVKAGASTSSPNRSGEDRCWPRSRPPCAKDAKRRSASGSSRFVTAPKKPTITMFSTTLRPSSSARRVAGTP